MPPILFLLFLFFLTFTHKDLNASELKAVPNIEAVNLKLKPAPSTVTCSDYTKLKESIAKDVAAYKTDRSFGEPEKQSSKDPSFIVFDMKSWTLSVCDKGNERNLR